MATPDSRRQSMGSRTSTPKPTHKAAAGTGPGDFDLSKAIGARVKITTQNSSAIEGTLFTACPVTNLIAINTSSVTSAASALPGAAPSITGNFEVLPVSRIQSFSIVSLSEKGPNDAAENPQPPVSRIDTKHLKLREEAAIRKAKEREADIGKGVTKEAQEIYDALARTLPVRWHQTSIIVNDSVMISPPYTPEACVAPKDQKKSLERVRLVLEDLRRRLAERKAIDRVASPSAPVLSSSSEEASTAPSAAPSTAGHATSSLPADGRAKENANPKAAAVATPVVVARKGG